MTTSTEKCISPMWLPQNSMAYPKYIIWQTPSGSLYPVGGHHIWVAKELANIIHTLDGPSPHHLKNTHHFVQHIKEAKVGSEEVMTSYDVKALFISVPVDPFINIVKQKIQQDPLLSQRTNMSIMQIITLLELLLKNTYFLFQGKYYKQVHGAAMGSWKSL